MIHLDLLDWLVKAIRDVVNTSYLTLDKLLFNTVEK